MEKNTVHITMHEIFKSPLRNCNQSILSIMASKGAPIKGTVILYLDPDYKWFEERDLNRRSVCYRWVENQEAKVGKNTICVSMGEIMNNPIKDARDAAIDILASKGAPVIGTIERILDPKYKWSEKRSSDQKSFCCTWTEKKDFKDIPI